MESFRYSCDCNGNFRIALNRFNDPAEKQQLEKAFDQLVDSAWDDEDEEADELLASVIHTMKGKHLSVPEHQLALMCNAASQNLDASIIFTVSDDHQLQQSCSCKSISQHLSILLNCGLAELNNCVDPKELRLMDVLRAIEPFLNGRFGQDRAVNEFCQALWSYSLKPPCKDSIVSKLVSIDPNYLNKVIENILAEDLIDVDLLMDEDFFKTLSSIVSISEVFRYVSFYIADKDFKSCTKLKVLLGAVLKTVKVNLPKAKYIQLYPSHLQSIVIVLNEIIDANDPVIQSMLEQIRKTTLLDYNLLVSHFPIFQFIQ
ncbi:uncharacterized protein LOC129751025 [Uranotaenia lowii]|uniref:uncharacterized protein LOC129751025 n=1 Tax=Uranotaenia lowii TaxID=190385 RepID=UPI00247917B5|nr:uncharacterized protein LOC129751025 [Uranotaenia lowii]